ncbi:Ima1 N-terminal domain-containing protein [Roridomyces roridus]|uniref:Ima1 N-terminal domain-containing protein n=1 Tax=Roridomyces roridus TaxID=1738132 RepID=A0AAD7BUB5_9AGAR|nr:Ima1 N-terminal domain-containing protein [Roridomyces roridus]
MLRHRNSNTTCFFCNSAIHAPDPRNFRVRCRSCGCQNHMVDGSIVSDDPAMYDEKLNSGTFSTPRNDSIPSMYARGVFCHTCETNQRLLVNLLANYLPPSGSPDSDERLRTLDEYRESLLLRYPPVCETCQPAVQEEIERKNSMARSQALGGWLNQTKGKARKRQVSLTLEETNKFRLEMLAWRIRGCLWVATALLSISGSASALLGYKPFSWLSFMMPGLPLIALVSLLWSAWDPTYSTFRSARIQGRDVRVQGKRKHIMLQMSSWTCRLVTSILLATFWLGRADYLQLSQFPSTRSRIYFSVSCTIELFAALMSLFVLRVQHPPSIRLINTTTHKTDLSRSRSQTPVPTHPNPPEPAHDLLAGLSFSSKPVIAPQGPVFGLPSMLSSSTAPADHSEADEMDVDWTPSDPKGKSKTADTLWLRPQRFFPPEAPTGLEGLFERTRIVDDVPMTDAPPVASTARWNWWWIYASSLLPLVALAYKAWASTRIREVPETFHPASET